MIVPDRNLLFDTRLALARKDAQPWAQELARLERTVGPWPLRVGSGGLGKLDREQRTALRRFLIRLRGDQPPGSICRDQRCTCSNSISEWNRLYGNDSAEPVPVLN